MEHGQEARKLAARFNNMAAAGLLDVKFYVRNPTSVTTETICREVNNLYRAVDDNKCKPLDFADSKR